MRTRRLIVVTPEGERELLFIGKLTVGRAPECDISVADTKISRRHAEFDASGPVPRVTDLGSRNGILVNGRKVGAADLAAGDIVTVGDARIRLDERAAEVAEPRATPITSDRTAVLPPMTAPVPGALPEPSTPATRSPKLGDTSGYRTHLMPPPAPPPAAPLPAPPPARTERVAKAPAPSPQQGARARESAPPPASAASAPATRPTLLSPTRVPVAAGGSVAHDVLHGPRVSWRRFATLAALLLACLSVLLGAAPVMWVSSRAVDALAERHALTLAGWLASGVDASTATVINPVVMEAVLASPGVRLAQVLERETGRVVAPAGGATAATAPADQIWRNARNGRARRVDAFTDAYVPAGGGAYVAWVRYERSASGNTVRAVLAALAVASVLAWLIVWAIARYTKAVVQLFTQQVRLAASLPMPRVERDGLLPGLDRLARLVTHLLEEHRVSGGLPSTVHASALLDTDDPALPVALRMDAGTPWIEVTSALQVVDASPPGHTEGAHPWANLRGRHLLDALDDMALRNAVVQGLSALDSQPGSETAVVLPDAATITLRREPSGHVRVTLGTR